MTRRAIVAIATTVMVVIALGTTLASAQTETGEIGSGGLQIVEHSSSTGPAGTVRIVVQLPGVIAPGDNLTLTIHEPVTSEAAFLTTTRGERLGGILDARTFSIDELAPDIFGLAEVIIDLNPQDGTLPYEDGQVRLARPGVYPVTFELRTADQDLVGRLDSHLIRLPDPTHPEESDIEPLSVVLVASVDLREGEAAALEWLATLASHPEVRMSTAITPEIFSRLEDAPEVAAFLDTAAPREIARGPLFPVDEAQIAGAGLSLELEAILAAGDLEIAKTGRAAPPTLWIDDGTASTSQLETLYERGVRDLMLQPDALASPLAVGPRQPIEVVAGDLLLRALVFDELAATTSHDTTTSAAQRIAAQLATIAFTDETRPIIALDLDRLSAGDPAVADALLSEISTLSLIDTTLATSALGAPLAVDGTRLPVRVELTADATDTAALTAYRDAASHLAAYRSMIRDEDARQHDRLADELLETLHIDVSEQERASTWRLVTDFVRQQTSLIDPPPEDSINLTSRTAKVPFSFQNRSETALRVEVRLISDKLRVADFDDGESTTVVLEPGVTNHEFELRALSSGSFPVTIELHSPNGGLLVSRTRAAIRSNTPTGVGLGLSAGAALFLLVWWVLDLRRRRIS